MKFGKTGGRMWQLALTCDLVVHDDPPIRVCKDLFCSVTAKVTRLTIIIVNQSGPRASGTISGNIM